jgi:hypothetical protein
MIASLAAILDYERLLVHPSPAFFIVEADFGRRLVNLPVMSLLRRREDHSMLLETKRLINGVGLLSLQAAGQAQLVAALSYGSSHCLLHQPPADPCP